MYFSNNLQKTSLIRCSRGKGRLFCWPSNAELMLVSLWNIAGSKALRTLTRGKPLNIISQVYMITKKLSKRITCKNSVDCVLENTLWETLL